MKKNIIRKEKIINETKDLMHAKLLIAFVNFAKVTSLEFKEIRQTLKKNNICLKVVKNTLVKRLLNSTNDDKLISYVSGQKILIFSDDIKLLVKSLYNISKIYNNFQVSCLYLYGRLYFGYNYYELCNVGTTEDILIKLIFELKTPIIKFINSIKYPYMQLLLVLKILHANIKGETTCL